MIEDRGRLRQVDAHAAQLSGNNDFSQKYFRELLKICARAEKPARSELEEAERAILQK